MEKFRRKRPTAVSLRCLSIKKDYRSDSFFTYYIAVYSYNSPTIPRPLDKVFFYFAHFEQIEKRHYFYMTLFFIIRIGSK